MNNSTIAIYQIIHIKETWEKVEITFSPEFLEWFTENETELAFSSWIGVCPDGLENATSVKGSPVGSHTAVVVLLVRTELFYL